MPDQSFPKSRRLLKRWEFDRTFDRGTVLKDDNIVIYRAEGLTEETRLGIVVGNQVKKATKRNRLKRVIRAGFRLEYVNLPEGIDIIVIPRINRDLSSKDVQKSLRTLLSDDKSEHH